MTDIVERLRKWSERTERAIAAPHRLCDEAADEIERLRGKLRIRDAQVEEMAERLHRYDGDPPTDGVLAEARKYLKSGLVFTRDVGQCRRCGTHTSSGMLKLCGDCVWIGLKALADEDPTV